MRPGRIYLARILNFLRILPKSGKKPVPKAVKDDVTWWCTFAEHYNGMSLMLEVEWKQPDWMMSSDSCLKGGGAFSQGEYFHWEFPQEVLNLDLNINQLECLTLVVATKLWACKL